MEKKCPVCSEVFPTPLTLKLHRQTHQMSYSCTLCLAVFTEKRSRFAHIREAHNGEKPFKCSECGKSFLQSSALKIHVRTHTGEKPYVCSECGKAFSSLSELKQHVKIHTGEKPYQCPDCPKSFSRQFFLRVHAQVHAKGKSFLCPECGQSFKGSRGLALHERTHIGAGWFWYQYRRETVQLFGMSKYICKLDCSENSY
jgi:KRAB domain-containing zinc finger protein